MTPKEFAPTLECGHCGGPAVEADTDGLFYEDGLARELESARSAMSLAIQRCRCRGKSAPCETCHTLRFELPKRLGTVWSMTGTPQWWRPAGAGVSGPRQPGEPAPRWPKSVSSARFLVEGRGGFLDVLETDDDFDSMTSILRGAGGNRLTYEEARAVANGLADHRGPLADELAGVIEAFLAGARDARVRFWR